MRRVPALLILVATASHGHWRQELQPTICTSPSRTYSLMVDPSDRFGAGPARYTLREHDRLPWSNRLTATDAQAGQEPDLNDPR